MFDIMIVCRYIDVSSTKDLRHKSVPNSVDYPEIYLLEKRIIFFDKYKTQLFVFFSTAKV